MSPEQQSAVSAEDRHLLILAGAGSGKTQTLIHRIAWLLHNKLNDNQQLLAVTFTNKAANELKERLQQLLGPSSGIARVQAGTFHSIARRHLLNHGQAVGLPSNFSIIDADDQKRLIRRLMKQEEINELHYPVQDFVAWLSRNKENGLRAHDVADEPEAYKRLYVVYEAHCRHEGLVDFSELLLSVYEMMTNHPEIRKHYQDAYSGLLVDEFQDTNNIQYKWLKLLTGAHTHTTVVGDDDQIIYTWRGACAENISSYAKEFSARIIKLERNYRSTAAILQTANSLIAGNKNRLGKKLHSTKEKGEKPCVYAAYNEHDEARFVSGIIEDWHANNRNLSEVAVLYRSNALSRVLEQEMLRARIPYFSYGGPRFYGRMEIKDTLAWLRLLQNPNDNGAFSRAIRSPKRGIGQQTLQDIQRINPEHPLWLNAQEYISQGRGKAAIIQEFTQLVTALQSQCAGLPLQDIVSKVLNKSKLLESYQRAQSGDAGIAPASNLKELVVAAGEYEKSMNKGGEGYGEYEENGSPLDQFLADATLNAGEQQAAADSDYVHLMTLHAAKGLEFPLVLMVGMEENLFPHIKSLQQQHGLEEERRLCYVGMTRAMEKLYMSWAAMRMTFKDRAQFSAGRLKSRFLRELPGELVQQAVGSMPDASDGIAEKKQQSLSPSGGIRPGQKVFHHKFGEGTVLAKQGKGEQERAQVNFATHGCKWLLLSHANLDTN